MIVVWVRYLCFCRFFKAHMQSEWKCVARVAKCDYTPQYKEILYEHGLLKHGFLVAAWQLHKMHKLSALSFHAGLAGARLLWPSILLPHVTGSVYHDFPWNLLPELLQNVDLQARIHLWFMHGCASQHFLHTVCEFFNTMFPEQWITGGTNSMGCFFPWFESHRFLCRRTSVVYCLCHRSRWHPGLAAVNTEWIGDDSYDTWNFPVNRAMLPNVVLKLKLDMSGEHNLELMLQEASVHMV